MKKIVIFTTCAMICGALATPALAGRFKPTDISSPSVAKPMPSGGALGSAFQHSSPQNSTAKINDGKHISDGAAKGQATE
jgi:hypothetical protein